MKTLGTCLGYVVVASSLPSLEYFEAKKVLFVVGGIKLDCWKRNLLLIVLNRLMSWLFIPCLNLRMLFQMTILLMCRVALSMYINQNRSLHPLF